MAKLTEYVITLDEVNERPRYRFAQGMAFAQAIDTMVNMKADLAYDQDPDSKIFSFVRKLQFRKKGLRLVCARSDECRYSSGFHEFEGEMDYHDFKLPLTIKGDHGPGYFFLKLELPAITDERSKYSPYDAKRLSDDLESLIKMPLMEERYAKSQGKIKIVTRNIQMDQAARTHGYTITDLYRLDREGKNLDLDVSTYKKASDLRKQID